MFILEPLLALFARLILRKYRPTVVAVTGSVGKTSTRNAIAAVLSRSFRVRSPEQNYNNEIGVPLTIIGATSPGRSIVGWLGVFWKAFCLLAASRPRGLNAYPSVLVLEYGLDRPGDIARLCRLAPPDVAVLTAITPVHVEAFGTIERLIGEKAEIVRGLKAGGLAVLNGDDAGVMTAKDARGGEASVVTYGFGEANGVRGERYRVETREGDPDGSFDVGEQFCAVHFDLTIGGGDRAPVALHNLLGRGQAYAALAAAAVGARFGLSVDEIVAGLADFKPQAGRMRPIAGIKGTLLLDDTYNAAPASMAAALETLRRFHPAEDARRVAVLGKMAELGRYSADEHRLLGLRAAEAADLLVCVGEEALDTRRGALEAGMDEGAVQWFGDSVEAGRWLDFHAKRGDVILIKGSQSARMERAVKDLMAEPLKAPELLVRQFGKWLDS
jgi:UDP-N-acetylmuramyl pentapeptide synthase